MKKRVGIFGLMVLAVILFCTSEKFPEQTPEKTENKQYAAAPTSSSEIIETNTVSATADACSEILVKVEPIINVQTEESKVTPQERSDALEAQVKDDVQIEPCEPDIATTESASPSQPSSSGLPGFDYVPYSGPNIVIKADDMYENGNKIGTMGDINKQVGIMD